MILPTKHVSTERSLLGLGALLLRALDMPRTVTALWHKVREIPEVGSFDRFVLALDLLYAMGAVDLNEGLIRRRTP